MAKNPHESVSSESQKPQEREGGRPERGAESEADPHQSVSRESNHQSQEDTDGVDRRSPVWRFLNNQRHAVGIHAYGGCPNRATRINTPMYNNMLPGRNL